MPIYSYDRYVSTGLTTYNITFDYLNNTHIDVYLDGVKQSSGYSVNDSTNILTFDSAPTSGTVVLLKRNTPKTKSDYQASVVNFTDGSVLTESDLDNAVLGLLYVSQEAEDAASSEGLGLDQLDEHWTAESKRIKQVATPVDDNDAVTKEYTDGLALYNSPTVPQVYTFTGDGSSVDFTWGTDPTSTDEKSFFIDIDGVVQKPTTDFTVTSTKLTFTTAPINGANITIRNIGVARDISTDQTAIKATGSTTTRTLSDRFADSVNVKDYGATGDGATDDTTAIQSALNSGSNRVYFPDGTYKVTSTLTVTSSNIEIDFQKAQINFSNDNEDTFLSISGTGLSGTQHTLAGDAAKGSETIDISSVTYTALVSEGWTAGTVFTLAATDSYSNDSSESVVAKPGELNIFEKWESSEDIVPIIPVSDSYTTANAAYVERVTLLENITIRGGNITGPTGSPTDTPDYDGHICIDVNWAKNVLIDGVTIHQFHARGIGLNNVMFGKVQNCHVSREEVDPIGASGHGVSLLNLTQDVVIEGCTFYNLRHTLSTNYTSAYPGVTRRIIFTDNNITNSTSNWSSSDGGDSLNTHIGTEEIHILNNTMDGGGGNAISIQAASGSIRGNTVTNSKDTAIQWINRTSRVGSIEISGNWIEKTLGGTLPNGNSASAYGIYVHVLDAQAVEADMHAIVIANNRIRNTYSRGIYVLGGTDATHEPIKGLTVTGNSIYNAGSYGLDVRYCQSFSITGNSINSSYKYGIHTNNCDNGSITGNSIYQEESEDGSAAITLDQTTLLSVVGNSAYTSTGTPADYGIRVEADSSSVTVTGNVATGFGKDLELPAGSNASQGLNHILKGSSTDLTTTGDLEASGPYGWYWMGASNPQAPTALNSETYWLIFNSGSDGSVGSKTRYPIAYGWTSSGFTGTTYGGDVTDTGTATWSFLNPSGSILNLKDGVTAPSAISGIAQLYVNAANGNLEIIFGNGFVRNVALDDE